MTWSELKVWSLSPTGVFAPLGAEQQFSVLEAWRSGRPPVPFLVQTSRGEVVPRDASIEWNGFPGGWLNGS